MKIVEVIGREAIIFQMNESSRVGARVYVFDCNMFIAKGFVIELRRYLLCSFTDIFFDIEIWLNAIQKILLLKSIF